jgi:hypothetical protein
MNNFIKVDDEYHNLKYIKEIKCDYARCHMTIANTEIPFKDRAKSDITQSYCYGSRGYTDLKFLLSNR